MRVPLKSGDSRAKKLTKWRVPVGRMKKFRRSTDVEHGRPDRPRPTVRQGASELVCWASDVAEDSTVDLIH